MMKLKELYMKNKERIEQLEKQLEVLANRVAILEMRANPKVAQPIKLPEYNYTPYITCNAKH